MKVEPDRSVNGRRAGKRKPRKTRRAAENQIDVVRESRKDSSIEESLRAWRLAEAKKRGLPAFRILTDKALRAIAAERPTSAEALLNVPGIGPATAKKYAIAICRLCARG